MNPIFMLLTKIRLPKLPRLSVVPRKYIVGTDEGTVVKGDDVQLFFSMCPHPDEATAKLIPVPGSGNFFVLHQLYPLVLVFNPLLLCDICSWTCLIRH